MRKNIKIFFILTITIISIFSMMAVVSATNGEGKKCTGWLENITPDGCLIPYNCLYGSDCNLKDIFQTIVNFSQIILALTGSAALLMFIYGGVMFIISSGNQERIQKAKQILVAAVVGIVIILSAWLIVNFIILALTGCSVGSQAKIFSTTLCNDQVTQTDGSTWHTEPAVDTK